MDDRFSGQASPDRHCIIYSFLVFNYVDFVTIEVSEDV